MVENELFKYIHINIYFRLFVLKIFSEKKDFYLCYFKFISYHVIEILSRFLRVFFLCVGIVRYFLVKSKQFVRIYKDFKIIIYIFIKEGAK